MDQCIKKMEKRVTDDMNQELLAPFTVEEVLVALQQIVPLKALGPDGYNTCFYKSYWNIVGNEVYSLVLDFLNGGVFDDAFNYTYIVIIPNSKNPTKANDIRPISLYNVINKLIFKVLVNKLMLIMPSIISTNQSVFLPS